MPMSQQEQKKPEMQFETVRVRLGQGEQEIQRPIVADGADFSEAAVIAEARRITGLHDFGDESFLPNLRKLIASMEQEADLNAYGRLFARQMLVGRLADRLRAQELFERHPEILERKLGAMVFVVGPARSGTTRAHRMLATDKRFLHLRDWEINFPVPNAKSFEARAAGLPDPRIARARGAHAMFAKMNPENLAVHGLNAEAPEEEIGLINLSFCGLMLEAQRWVPSFGWHCLQQPQRHAYEYMKKMIQLVAWFRNDPPDQPWVFKSPQHMQDLDSLMAVFPDAKIVFMHRDPLKVVPSNCSMNWNLTILGSDRTDPAIMGAFISDKLDAQLHKVEKERATLIPKSQQLDVLYENMNRDWRGQMQRIYDFIGLEFTADAAQNMQHHLDTDRTHTVGGHRYRLEDFGLDAAQLNERFKAYRDRYNIPREENKS
jgi:hypothetical protein